MIPRISPQESHTRVNRHASLLVCAYGSDDQCQSLLLAGALLPSEFKARVNTLPKDQEIIFYCA